MKNITRRSLLAGTVALAATAAITKVSSAEVKDQASSTLKKPKYRGVVYDVGLNFTGDGLSVPTFSSELVEYDIKIIARILHCNAIRIEGEVIERLVAASRIAHKEGLSVLFNPWKMNANAAELKPYYIEAARAAELLRQEGVDLIFVAGCEFTIFQRGILPGETLTERLSNIGALFSEGFEKLPEKMAPLSERINQHLKEFVIGIRNEYKGKVSYAALAFEQIDWSIFDIVGIDHYRSAETEEQYVHHFNSYKVHGKPVFCMEVGCCTYEGAGTLGAGGFTILESVNPDGTINFRDSKPPKRSETEQADYVETQVTLLANNDADGIFVFVFSFPIYPHYKSDPRKDLDVVSFALVKTFPQDDPRSMEMPPWAPKESFHRLATLYSQMDQA